MTAQKLRAKGKGKRRILAIKDLVFDEDVYPRMKVGWLTAYQYAQAIKAGAEFPAIIVGFYKDRYYVIDGWHRVEAHRVLKEQMIQAIIYEYSSKRDMFADAVVLNVVHGRQLSVQERVRIVDTLKEMDFTRIEIGELVRIPTDKLGRFEARVIIRPNGEKLYLKSLTDRADGQGIEEGDQDTFSVRDVLNLLTQLVSVLRADIFPAEDTKVQERGAEAYSLLGQRLELA